MKNRWYNKLLVALVLVGFALHSPLHANDQEDYKRSCAQARQILKLSPEEYDVMSDNFLQLELKLLELQDSIKEATNDSKVLSKLFEHDKSVVNLGRNHWYLKKSIRRRFKTVYETMKRVLSRYNYRQDVHRFLRKFRYGLGGSMAVDWWKSQPADSLPKALVKLDRAVKELLSMSNQLRNKMRRNTGDYSCLQYEELCPLLNLMAQTKDYLSQKLLPVVRSDCKVALTGIRRFQSVSHGRKGLAIGWRLSNPHFDILKSLQTKGYTIAVKAEHSGYPKAYAFWGNLKEILNLIRMDNFGPKASLGGQAVLELRQRVEKLIKQFEKEMKTLQKDCPMVSLFDFAQKLQEAEVSVDDQKTNLLGVVEDETVKVKDLKNTIVDNNDIDFNEPKKTFPPVPPVDSPELEEIARRMRQMFIDAGWEEEKIPETFTPDGLKKAVNRAKGTKPESEEADYETFQPRLPKLPTVKRPTIAI